MNNQNFILPFTLVITRLSVINRATEEAPINHTNKSPKWLHPA